MAVASEVHSSVFERGSAVLLARIVDVEGQAIQVADVASIEYTISRVAGKGPAASPAVAGHDQAALTPAAVLSDALQTGPVWTVDAEGYNFRHEIDVRTQEAFPEAGVDYQVRYEVYPTNGQKVVFRFLLRAI